MSILSLFSAKPPEKPVFAAKSVNERISFFNEQIQYDGKTVNRISEKYHGGEMRVIIAGRFNWRVILAITGNELDCYERFSDDSRRDLCPYRFMAELGAHAEIKPEIMNFLKSRGPLPRSLHEPAIS